MLLPFTIVRGSTLEILVLILIGAFIDQYVAYGKDVDIQAELLTFAFLVNRTWEILRLR